MNVHRPVVAALGIALAALACAGTVSPPAASVAPAAGATATVPADHTAAAVPREPVLAPQAAHMLGLLRGAPSGPSSSSRTTRSGTGRASISAVYPATGARTEPDAVIDVLPSAIERITIEPALARTNVFNSFAFTAIGHYGDGRTINVTSQVRWIALQPSIADSIERSRFSAFVPGTTGITAEHPTGVSSGDSNDDATLRVEPLEGLTLAPATRTVRVGDTVRFTLTGQFEDGTSINVTQRAYYHVDAESYPAPAHALNADDDRWLECASSQTVWRPSSRIRLRILT